MLYEKDGSLATLQGKTIGILGFGSQGHAHALNGRDSGISVIVSELPETDNYKFALDSGFQPLPADRSPTRLGHSRINSTTRPGVTGPLG